MGARQPVHCPACKKVIGMEMIEVGSGEWQCRKCGRRVVIMRGLPTGELQPDGQGGFVTLST
tara:strand:- start:222 stop:407 length:186 start_codon:yes stop_codon:yes gene_type:complete